MKHYSKEFDALDHNYTGKRVRIARTTHAELAEIYPKITAAFMQHMASLETCEHIRRRHHDNMWSIRDQRDGKLIGLYAMAMLTPTGHRALTNGEFDAPDPKLTHVAATGDPLSAIYKWGVYAPGPAVAAVPMIADLLAGPDYRHLDLYGNGSTEAGRRIMQSLGFRPVSDPKTPLLHRYERVANRLRVDLTEFNPISADQS